MQAVVTAGGGFLLSVLWFDLMFDVQVRGHVGEVPADVRASIAAYYRRVTTAARPMNRLVALAMLATLGGIVVQAARDEAPVWVSVVSIITAGAPITLAGTTTVPSAVRLGTQRDDALEQSALARRIYAQHVACAICIASLLAVQLGWA